MLLGHKGKSLWHSKLLMFLVSFMVVCVVVLGVHSLTGWPECSSDKHICVYSDKYMYGECPSV